MNRELEPPDDVTFLNAKDSLRHALDHFVELSDSTTEKWHHQKWIILSLHHAASCIVNLWLKVADEKHPIFFDKNGKEAYPHLDQAIKALNKYKGTKYLSDAESDLLILLKRLNDIRNKFMHRLPPQEINKEVVAYAATAMVGLLHVIERRSGKTFYEQFDEYPEMRKYIIEAIHSSKVVEYFSFVEKVLKDNGNDCTHHQCPICGSQAVVGSHCEACFEDLTEVECPNCNCEFFIHFTSEQACPLCGCENRA